MRPLRRSIKPRHLEQTTCDDEDVARFMRGEGPSELERSHALQSYHESYIASGSALPASAAPVHREPPPARPRAAFSLEWALDADLRVVPRYVPYVPRPPPPPAPPRAASPVPRRLRYLSDLEDARVVDLKHFCRQHGLHVSGNRDELLVRVEDWMLRRHGI